MLIDLLSYKMVENLTKMADQLPRHQVPLVSGEERFSAQYCFVTDAPAEFGVRPT